MKWVRWCTVAVTLLVGSTFVAVVPAPASADATAALPSSTELEQQFTALVNGTREQNGLPPLATDGPLADTARAWSAHMRDANALAHDPNLVAVVTAIDPTWSSAAENVGVGFDVASLYQAFLDSASHKANITGTFNRVGIGVVVDGGKIWITQRFLLGTPLPPPEPIDPPPAGTDAWFHPLTPNRVLDTRDGTGSGGFAGPVGSGGTISLQVAGTAGVPATGVSAVMINVTVTGATGPTHLTVFPSGTTRPASSNLNVVPGETVANMVDARLGSDGRIKLYNNAGMVHVIADVAGYFDANPTGGARFEGVTPTRLLDTRNGTGGVAVGKVGPGVSRTFTAAGTTPVPAGATAVALSVTAVAPTLASHLTVWPAGTVRPNASSVNFPAGATVPNLAIVPVGSAGGVSVFNNAGNVHVVADVLGYFSPVATGGHTPVTPTRVRDTRFGPGAIGKVGPGGEIAVQVNGANPAADAVVLNVTALDATVATHVTVYPDGSPLPVSSNVNLVPGQVKPVLVTVRVGPDGKVRLRNNAGSVNLIVDVLATFDDTP